MLHKWRFEHISQSLNDPRFMLPAEFLTLLADPHYNFLCYEDSYCWISQSVHQRQTKRVNRFVFTMHPHRYLFIRERFVEQVMKKTQSCYRLLQSSLVYISSENTSKAIMLITVSQNNLSPSPALPPIVISHHIFTLPRREEVFFALQISPQMYLISVPGFYYGLFTSCTIRQEVIERAAWSIVAQPKSYH